MNRLVLIICLLFGLNGATAPSWADGKSAMEQFIASGCQKCEEQARRLEQLKHELDQNSSATSADVEDHKKAAQLAIDRIRSLEAQPPPTSAVEAETRAKDMYSAYHIGLMVEQTLGGDLGVHSSSSLDHAKDFVAHVQSNDAFFRFGKTGGLSNVGFDQAPPNSPGRQVFQLNPTVTMAVDVPATTRDLKERVDDWVKVYGSGPQGVVLEGTATGIGEVHNVRYDAAFNALILDEKDVYPLPTAPWTTAVLCRAIAEDRDENRSDKNPMRVGVSIGRTFIAYGKLPKGSDVAQDLFMVDKWLADAVVFAQRDWSYGYKYADGYVPQAGQDGDDNAAVAFRFTGFRFQIDNGVVHPTQDGFDATVYPVQETPARDSGGLPDDEAIDSGKRFPAFERNAKHLEDHISYYRKEPVVERAFELGEVAAVLRDLSVNSHVDLKALARQMDGAI